MKYFTIKFSNEPEEQILTKKTSLVRAIRENPGKIEYIYRYWWSGDDLIECTHLKAEEVFLTRAKDLTRGHTQNWAIAHHTINNH